LTDDTAVKFVSFIEKRPRPLSFFLLLFETLAMTDRRRLAGAFLFPAGEPPPPSSFFLFFLEHTPCSSLLLA